jgi:hypothetical protein
VAVTRARCHAETIEFVARKKAEGKTHREAVRSLKSHLVGRIWQLLRGATPCQKRRPIDSLTKEQQRRLAGLPGLGIEEGGHHAPARTPCRSGASPRAGRGCSS